MRSIVRYFVRYPIAANLIMIGLIVLGVFGARNMKSTFFPEVPSRNISVQVVLPGAAPEEIEEGIIDKIEENLKGVTGIDRVTSVSQENSGSVNIEVLEGYSAVLVVDDVRNAVDRIASFPAGLEPPVVYVRENVQPAITLGISGNVSLGALKTYGRKVETELLAMDGISKVEVTGFPEEEIQIAFRENDLQAYGLTFAQAATAIRGSNLDITGGTIKTEGEELLLRSRAKDYYAEGLRDIVIKTSPAGGVVRLYQVADVTDRWAEDPTRTYINEAPAVVVTVSNTIEEDMLTITETVRNYIIEFNEDNKEVKASIVSDRSVTLNDRIDLLSENGLLGFFIVAIMLAMFLNWRLAFWVALSIPISFAGMFLCAYLLGVTINVLSLFGMILVIGILVDDGIVIGENIYQRWELGMDREDPDAEEQVLAEAEATGILNELNAEQIKAGQTSRTARQNREAENSAVEGTMQVLPAVTSAIATTVVAFSTFFFIRGRLGDFFAEMAVVVILSLIFSLIEGVIILPTHVANSKALRADPHAKKPWLINQFDKFMNFLRDTLYAPVLNFAMKYRLLTIASMTALLFISFGAVGGGIVGTTFFPNIPRDDINIDLQMPAGTREGITQEYLDRIYAAVEMANDSLSAHYYNNEKRAIEKVQVDLGPSTFQGRVKATLIDSEERDSLKVRTATNMIRKFTGAMPAAESLTFGGASAFGKPVSVSLRGSNSEQLDAASNEVADALRSLKELADVTDSNKEGLREINILLNEKGRYLGLNESSVLAQVRAGFFGQEVQRLQRGRDEVRVWVRYAEDNRRTVDQLTSMRIRTAQGEYVLGDIATLDTERGIVSISHTDGAREVTISSDISSDDVSVSDVTSNLRTVVIPDILASYPGVSANYEGQNREQAKTSSSLALVGPIVLMLMLFIIALTFRSVSQTIIVFLLIPFAFIGVIWGHWLMDLVLPASFPLSLFSGLGIIALIGVLVNDALVLVTSYNELLERGMPQMEAMKTAALGRFRPIILTTVTTLAGLGPIMFETSLQAQFLIPMAISVSFGLFATTIGLLILLPAMIIWFNRFKVIVTQLWEGVRPAYADVEAATPNSSVYNWPLYAISTVVFLIAISLLMMLGTALSGG
ncbi:MAG: efflux RND transporter permease subunit [Saprospiraceae bacterium]